MSLIITKFGINHDTSANGKIFASKERGGDCGICIFMPVEHSLWGCLENGFTILLTSKKCYRITTKMFPHKFKKKGLLYQITASLSNHNARDQIKITRNYFFGIMLNTKTEICFPPQGPLSSISL